jgi:hypothetical protein
MEKVRTCEAEGCKSPLKRDLQLYCSTKCKLRVYRKKIKESITRTNTECLYCKSPLSGNLRKKFCNSSHKSYYYKIGERKGDVKYTCLFCKKESTGKFGKKFCSQDHKEEYYKKIKYKKEVPTLKKCLYPHCNEEFMGLAKKLYCCEDHAIKNYLLKRAEERKNKIVPQICRLCNTSFIPSKATSKIFFCSTEHKKEHYRINRRGKYTIKYKHPDGLEEKRICLYCTTEYRSNKRAKFCCDEHQMAFASAVKKKQHILVKINSKLTVRTKKYDRILQILEKYKSHSEDLSHLNPTFVGGR